METHLLDREPINSPSDLMTWADHLERTASTSGPFLYRGQPAKYGNLQPTLARRVGSGAYQAAIMLERRLITSFREHYQALKNLPNDMPASGEIDSRSDVDILSLMQHYEIPSRLLDWSESIWVATYFACASNAESDAELWYVSEAIFDPTPEDIACGVVREKVCCSIGTSPAEYHPKWGMPNIAIVEPMSNARLLAQKGRLTACDNVTVDHAGLIERLVQLHRLAAAAPREYYGRHIIKASRKRDILRFLASEKGVSAKSLFPDIVGLGRFLHWEFEALRNELY